MKNSNNKNAYDLTVLLSEDDTSFVENLLKDNGVDDIKKNVTKVNFAYEVSGETQGFMAVFRFTMNPDSVGVLNKKFKSEPTVLRHLLLRDTLKEKESSSGKKESKSSKPSKPKKKKDEDEPLTNEAIEQKIEEIKE